MSSRGSRRAHPPGARPGARPARDPLALVEQAAVAEEILAVLRHGLGNRLGTLRNAAFFVRRRVARATAEEDPRVDRFLQTIDDEVVTAHALVEEGAAMAQLAPRRVERTCAAGGMLSWPGISTHLPSALKTRPAGAAPFSA